MSDHKYNQNLLIGAAVAAGILGTLTGMLGLRKDNKKWTEQAKDIADQIVDSSEMVNKKMVLGGVAGGVVGAVAALLLAPKAGSELIKDIAKPFIHEEHPRKKHAQKKKESHSPKKASTRKAQKHTEEKVTPRSKASKKGIRRKTAAHSSKLAAIPEKLENETRHAE